jgi:hypothetical protein
VIANANDAQGETRRLKVEPTGGICGRASVADEVFGILDRPTPAAVQAARQPTHNAQGRVASSLKVMALLFDEIPEGEPHENLAPAVPAPQAVVGRPAAELAGLAGDDDILHWSGFPAGYRVFATTDCKGGDKTTHEDKKSVFSIHILLFRVLHLQHSKDAKKGSPRFTGRKTG